MAYAEVNGQRLYYEDSGGDVRPHRVRRPAVDVLGLRDDAIGLLDHLGIPAAVLAGMSQGGFLSLRAALRYPARVPPST